MVKADDKRSTNFKNQYSKKEGERQHVDDPEKKLTVARKVSETLGITQRTFERQIQRAITVAKKAGLELPQGKQTAETLSGDQLIAIGQKVGQATGPRIFLWNNSCNQHFAQTIVC